MKLKIFLGLVILLGLSSCVNQEASRPVKQNPPAPKEYGMKRGIPALFRENEVDSKMLALAANHYIAMGRDRAIVELKSLEQDTFTASKSDVNRNHRIGWLCRILFSSKGKTPLGGAGYGSLTDLPWRSMPLSRWPHYPLAEQSGVYFVLSSSYALAGVAEEPSSYIDYCSANGEFRNTQLQIPTAEIAVKALGEIKNSSRWKVIKWKDKGLGGSYTLGENWVLQNLQRQTLIDQ